VDFEPGIHFGLPDEEYHSVPALSNSGIKNLRISTLDFWARSWMNPDKEVETSEFMEMGKAYHARIVEGREAFLSRYAPMLDVGEYPEAIRTADELRAALADADPKAKKGGTKAELAARLLALRPDAVIWETLEKEHANFHAGKTLLPGKLLARIELAAAMIEKHPVLSKAFSGGHPEVSIFWKDETSGVPMKARLDYLKLGAVVDLKTFSNPQGKPIDKAVAWSIAAGRYHVQVAVYQEAVRAAKGLVLSGAVHGTVDGGWLQHLATARQPTFLFVFQQTGIAPVARGYVFPHHLTYDIGVLTMREAQRQFAECVARFGTDPWIDTAEIQTIEDSELPAFIGD
jgi:hypothetical protein